MATPNFISLSSLRRSWRICNSLYFSAAAGHHHFLIPSSPPTPSLPYNSSVYLHTPRNFLFRRSFSTRDSVDHWDNDSDLNHSDLVSSVDFSNAGGNVIGYEDSIIPVRALISLLDGYHDLTGLPWWIVIASSTLMFRLALFPFIVLQLQKLKRIGELFPKLPPPLPPPFSGITFRQHFKFFQRVRKEVGCPPFAWFGASLVVQVPLFLLGVSTIRTMSLDHHPGFDCGGTLWFQNLTEYPNGAFGPVFPLLIAGLYYTNIQVSFENLSSGKVSGLFETLIKYYKIYLEVLTIPIMIFTFNMPQGSLVYWLVNSSFTLGQQFVLKHPDVRKKLMLPDKGTPTTIGHDEIGKTGAVETNPSEMVGEISQQRPKDLSPKELVALSIKFLTTGCEDNATSALRLALDKDPQYVRALVIIGQISLQQGRLVEATQYMEQAISKLLVSGLPTEVEDIDLLILSSMWAGSAYIRQGKNEEGMMHLERLAGLEEPEDAKSKAHYYDGLLLLSSALYSVGRKAEAVEHLHRAAGYDPGRYNEFLEQCESDEDDFADKLASSRRADL